MSLRVLLADESDTIKKVFQLALQDLNIEIKTVQSGLDVVNVAQSFRPQIIFADVLLQKKNGYDMCLEIKQTPALATIPVILMWSSFMELDQEQFKKSQAEDQLEKPFDADLLRNLVKKYVPSAGSNPISQFLKFPKSLKPTAEAKKPSPPKASAPIEEKAEKEDASEFNLNSILGDLAPASDEAPPSFSDDVIEMPSLDSPPPAEFAEFKIDTSIDPLEKFESFNLTKATSPNISAPPDFVETEEKSEMLMTDIDHIQPTQLDTVFKSKSPTGHTRTEISIPQKLKDVSLDSNDIYPSPHSSQKIKGLDDSEIEAIVRAHTEEFLKNQLQDSLMNIVEKIVREELNKVLEEEVRLKQELQDDSP